MGQFTGGTWAKIIIPAAGAYPFRLIYENGTGDAGVEWSVFVTLSDGGLARVAVNDTNVAGSIQAFQASSANSGPWVSYIQPPPWAHDLQPFQPILVRLTDGSTFTTDAAHIDGLTIDGTNQTFNATKAANVTTVLQTSGLPWPNANVGHTNVLRFRDSAGTSFTNTWFTIGSAPYVNPFATFTIPSSYRVDTNSLSQPGFRIRSAQVISGTTNNVSYAEQILEGLAGANVANQSHTNGPGFFVWTNSLDFSITPNGGPNAGGGEWTWDNCLTNGGLGQGPSVAREEREMLRRVRAGSDHLRRPVVADVPVGKLGRRRNRSRQESVSERLPRDDPDVLPAGHGEQILDPLLAEDTEGDLEGLRLSGLHVRGDGRGLKAFDDEVDAQRKLP